MFTYLGLVIYDDSDASKSSSDSEDDEPHKSNKPLNEIDSDEELMVCDSQILNFLSLPEIIIFYSLFQRTIARRKAAFRIKSSEIEDYLARSEEKEKKLLEKDGEDAAKPEANADSDEDDDDNVDGSTVKSVVSPSGKSQTRTESGEIQQDKNKLKTSRGKFQFSVHSFRLCVEND